MPWNAGAGRMAEVQADVEAVGIHDRLERANAAARHQRQFRKRRFVQVVQIGGFLVGRHQQVPAVVGVAVQENEAVPIAVNDEVADVVLASGDAGKQRLIAGRRLGRQNIINPPRGVETFHSRDFEGKFGKSQKIPTTEPCIFALKKRANFRSMISSCRAFMRNLPAGPLAQWNEKQAKNQNKQAGEGRCRESADQISN